mmetsp:Transcript_22378/g.70117  ORF Transcript_22378/g.70117 Transcript_22378/m.70117 type:complete len:193 (-) Transcript_22378:17-595(-)
MRICAAVIGAVATHAFVAPQPRLCRRRRPLVRAEDAERLPTLEELALKRADSLIEADAAAADAAPRLDSAASSLGASEALKADAKRFRQRREALGDAGAPVGPSPIKSVVNVLGTVLSVNFVVIFGLFLWFLSGVFSLYALDNDAVINAVKAAFDPFILPLLSTHMGLTFFSYGLEKTFGENDPEDDGGFRL